MHFCVPFARVALVSRCAVPSFRLCAASASQSTTPKGGSDKKSANKKTEPAPKMAGAKEKEPSKPMKEKEPVKTSTGTQTDFDISTYKVQAYFCHNEWTFYDMESVLSKHRLPQPSSVKGFP